MSILGLLTVLAAAGTPPSAAEASLCGLEEVNRPDLKTCPPHVTYDEDGEIVGGEDDATAQGEAGRDAD